LQALLCEYQPQDKVPSQDLQRLLIPIPQRGCCILTTRLFQAINHYLTLPLTPQISIVVPDSRIHGDKVEEGSEISLLISWRMSGGMMVFTIAGVMRIGEEGEGDSIGRLLCGIILGGEMDVGGRVFWVKLWTRFWMFWGREGEVGRGMGIVGGRDWILRDDLGLLVFLHLR
jgi:hypothetical protein